MEELSTNETPNDNETAGNDHFFNFFTLSNIYNNKYYNMKCTSVKKVLN